jgi:AbrB family looped-hinge helix DNA binding protein
MLFRKVVKGGSKSSCCQIKMVMVILNGMKDITVPIDQAGRIVLPKDIRQELAIMPGDTFKISISGSNVTLTPNKETSGFVRKGRALVFSSAKGEVLTQETINELLENEREMREDQSLAGRRAPRRKR